MSLIQYLRIFLFVVIITVIVMPGTSNIPPKGVASRFIIEENGHSFNDPVDYTIGCYSQKEVDAKPGVNNREKTIKNTSYLSKVFQLSGTCLPHDCQISKISLYYPSVGEEEPHFVCVIMGTTNDLSFTVWNSTGESGLHCFETKELYDIYRVVNGTIKTYNYTQEYLDCEKNLMKSIHYHHYPCEIYLANQNIDRKQSNLTLLGCDEIYDREIPLCFSYLKEVNLSWSGYQKTICEYRFTIAHDNASLEEPDSLNQSLYIPKSPVESLYCGIVQLFGGRCE